MTALSLGGNSAALYTTEIDEIQGPNESDEFTFPNSRHLPTHHQMPEF
ncbi:hypothetical protein [Streptomyces sp. NPDC051921]